MASALTWILAVAVLLAPPASVVGLILWARGLSKAPGTPPYAAWVAYGLAALGGLAVAAGLSLGVVSTTSALNGEMVEPSERARHLGEGISEAMNCGALGLLIAAIAAAWVLFWRWRARRV